MVSKTDSSLLSNSILTIVGTVIGVASSFVMRIFVGRFSSVSVYGNFIFILSIINILGIVGILGLNKGIARQLPREDQKAKLSTSVLILTGIMYLILRSSFYAINKTFGIFNNIDNGVVIPLLLFISVPCFTLVKISSGIFQGYEDMKGRALSHNILYQGGAATLSIIAAFFTDNIEVLVLFWTGGLLITAIISMVSIRRKIIFNLISVIEADFIEIKSLLVLSFPLMLSNTVSRFLHRLIISL